MEITTNVLQVEINGQTRHVTVTAQPRVVEVHVGQRGLPGPAGPPAETPERTAAETVSALRLLSESADGVRHLDPADDASVAGMLGVSITAASAGQVVKVQRGGSLDDAGWSWTPGLVFAGPNGTLVQTPPASGWEIVVGHAPSATRLNLSFDEPVELA